MANTMSLFSNCATQEASVWGASSFHTKASPVSVTVMNAGTEALRRLTHDLEAF